MSRRHKLGAPTATELRRRRKRLPDLLDALGKGEMDLASFWRSMTEAGLGQGDIDTYCEKHARHSFDAITFKDPARSPWSFTCLRCGAEVWRPDRTLGDDEICLNCTSGG
jgi:hypothetical protein